ncbi:acyltransferase [Cellulomonas cellasea]|uniref:Acetyltransferase n=2 Tax=Cellulomonas cellasea TaxID=43670 RepID=A0A0A0B7B8_9CELL|nr:acyltransferase [Cellulomonas cellasea]KGM02113.1 hypothetical protein Q760_15360 [Cellulomonas cellasea DSM 20118]GEA89832.1 transferase [Cellulomonas cellasea]
MGVRRLVRDVTLNTLCASALVPRAARWRLLRALGLDIPGWCAVAPGCWFGGRRITIGRDSTVNYGVFFDNSARITIGERCDIGMLVMLCTGTHTLGDAGRRAGAATAAPIELGPGVWVGARAVVLPGVHIGAGCVIGAGAVVAKDCPPHGLYVGVPARRVRELDPEGRPVRTT